MRIKKRTALTILLISSVLLISSSAYYFLTSRMNVELQLDEKRLADQFNVGLQVINMDLRINNIEHISNILKHLYDYYDLRFITLQLSGKTIVSIGQSSVSNYSTKTVYFLNPMMRNQKVDISFAFKSQSYLHLSLGEMIILLIMGLTSFGLFVFGKSYFERIESEEGTRVFFRISTHNLLAQILFIQMCYEELNKLRPDLRKKIIKLLDSLYTICRGWEDKVKNSAPDTQQHPVYLTDLVTNITKLSRDALGVAANYKCTPDAFVMGIEHDLESTMRTLLKNAAEEIPDDRTGEINVNLSKSENTFIITVTDNGKGISEDAISSLFTEGSTFGKKDGTGYGLFHAKKAIESFGGRISLTSTSPNGSTFEIVLPQTNPAPWFTSEILLKTGVEIVILDDDPIVHMRFKTLLNPYMDRITVRNIHTAMEFKEYMKVPSKVKRIYFVDLILDDESQGMNLIEQLGIASTSILVTGDYYKKDIQNRATAARMKILPKHLLDSTVKITPTWESG